MKREENTLKIGRKGVIELTTLSITLPMFAFGLALFGFLTVEHSVL